MRTRCLSVAVILWILKFGLIESVQCCVHNIPEMESTKEWTAVCGRRSSSCQTLIVNSDTTFISLSYLAPYHYLELIHEDPVVWTQPEWRRATISASKRIIRDKRIKMP